MTKTILQWVFMAGVIYAFFDSMKAAVCGRQAVKPTGYRGVVTTTLAYAAAVAIHILAGFYRELIP